MQSKKMVKNVLQKLKDICKVSYCKHTGVWNPTLEKCPKCKSLDTVLLGHVGGTTGHCFSCKNYYSSWA